jgi:adenine-specific DNA-methyltransferase
MPKPRKSRIAEQIATYGHKEADSPMRPDDGTQAQFKKKKPPKTYRYDSSLSPALDWDGQSPARERGEALIREILDAGSLEAAKASAAKLKALGKPFLNWAGKAERISFDVPTLPLFIHERLSTKAILETLKGHKRALRGQYEDAVWDHLAGTTSAPFEPGERRQIAVKVIDDRGNELLVVQKVG